MPSSLLGVKKVLEDGVYISSKAKNWVGLLLIPYWVALIALCKPSSCNQISYFFRIKLVRCPRQSVLPELIYPDMRKFAVG